MTILSDIADAADELTDPRELVIPIFAYDGNRNRKKVGEHRIRHTALLQYLADVAVPGRSEANGPAGTPRSRPPVNLDAVSKYAAIQIGAVKWCWALRIEPRVTDASYYDLEATIRGLVGAASSAVSDQQAELLVELRRWRRWAAVATGFEEPARTLRAPCPVVDCGAMGSLRIWAGERSGVAVTEAWCEECGTRWTDTAQLQSLASVAVAYERAQRAEAVAARARARAAAAADTERRRHAHASSIQAS